MVEKNNQQLIVVETNLKTLLHQKQAALPENFNQTRFLQNCLYVLSDVKDIDKMEPLSVSRTMLKGAFLGLDFFNKECYAIPYNKNIGTKEKPQWVKELQFQTDYKGERKNAKKYSITPVRDIYAMGIHKDDSYPKLTIQDGLQHLYWEPNTRLFIKDPGDCQGIITVIVYQDGGFYYEIMPVEEIEHIRWTYSKAPKSDMWSNRWIEGAKKTGIRKICKVLNLEFENSDQDAAWKDGADVDFDNYEEIKEPVAMSKKIETKTDPKKKTESEEKPKDKLTEKNFNALMAKIKKGQFDRAEKALEIMDMTDEQRQDLENGIKEMTEYYSKSDEKTEPTQTEAFDGRTSKMADILSLCENKKTTPFKLTGYMKSELESLGNEKFEEVYKKVMEANQ